MWLGVSYLKLNYEFSMIQSVSMDIKLLVRAAVKKQTARQPPDSSDPFLANLREMFLRWKPRETVVGYSPPPQKKQPLAKTASGPIKMQWWSLKQVCSFGFQLFQIVLGLRKDILIKPWKYLGWRNIFWNVKIQTSFGAVIECIKNQSHKEKDQCDDYLAAFWFQSEDMLLDWLWILCVPSQRNRLKW